MIFPVWYPMLTFVPHQKSLAELRSAFTSENIRDAKVLMALVLMRSSKVFEKQTCMKVETSTTWVWFFLKCQCKCQFEVESFGESKYIMQRHWLHLSLLLWEAALGIRARNVHSKARDPSPLCERTPFFSQLFVTNPSHGRFGGWIGFGAQLHWFFNFEWYNPRWREVSCNVFQRCKDHGIISRP